MGSARQQRRALGLQPRIGVLHGGSRQVGPHADSPAQGRALSLAKGLGPWNAISSLRTLDTTNIWFESRLPCAVVMSLPGTAADTGCPVDLLAACVLKLSLPSASWWVR